MPNIDLSASYQLLNAVILDDGQRSAPSDITVRDGIIAAIAPTAHADSPVKFVTAGYIDEHTHGGNGYDYFACTQAASDAVGSFHLNNGTTAFCATAVATPLDELDRQFALIRALDNNYATLLGVHIEGPFISLSKKGAQPEKNIRTSFSTQDAAFFSKNCDILRIVTLCPHTDNAPELVRALTTHGITAHAGHDDSVQPEIDACIQEGLSAATHLYCASSGLRRVGDNIEKFLGLNETALLDGRLMAEVIGDTVHISKSLFQLIVKNKCYRNVILVSDSLSAAGMPVGDYMLGVDTPIYNNGTVALLQNRKTLAGSVCPVGKMVQNVVSFGFPLEQATYMANNAPAKHLHLTERGFVRIGLVADLLELSPSGEVLTVHKVKA